jgi:hypothetical protein
MLTPVADATERDGDYFRSWFADDYFDLIVWSDEHREIASFQLCYNKGVDEYALTWIRPSSYHHQRVDDGENRPGRYKSTPVLIPDGSFPAEAIAERFKQESSRLDPALAEFIHEKILGETEQA